MENLGKVTIILLALIVRPFINGFVLSKLINWFIVPVSYIKPINTIEAVGILLVINFITIRHFLADEKDSFFETIFWDVINSIFVAMVALLLGYIIKSFI